MVTPLLQSQNPYQKIDAMIEQEQDRGWWSSWQDKSKLAKELLIVANLVDCMKSSLGTMRPQLAAVQAARRIAERAESKPEKYKEELLFDPKQSKMECRKEEAKTIFQLKNLYTELMIFSRDSGRNFLESAIAEVFDAFSINSDSSGDTILAEFAKASAVSFFKGEVDEGEMQKQFLNPGQTSMPEIRSSCGSEGIAKHVLIGLERFLVKLVLLQAAIDGNIQLAASVQAKALAGALSVGVALSQLVAISIQKRFFHSCTDICSG